MFPRPEFIEKHNLKRMLSFPITKADPAVYILSGTLPIEAMIDQQALTFFVNISRLPELSVENQLAFHKLKVKTLDSNSWFVAVRENMYHVWPI